MKLAFNDDDPEAYGPWVAATDDGKYDAAGANPLDAVTALVRTIEWHALGLRDEEIAEGERR